MTRFLGSAVTGGDDVGREYRAAFGVSTVVVTPTERIDRERAERTRNDQGRGGEEPLHEPSCRIRERCLCGSAASSLLEYRSSKA
jgi:hypothetical protein